MRRIELSIVIPCKDDPRVVRCVDSVDANCEIVIVFNGSHSEFMRAVRRRLDGWDVSYLTLPQANLARALQHGIDHARHDAVLLMDSDCVFRPNAIAEFAHASARGDSRREVYKGRILFEAGDGVLGSVIARTRRQHTAARLTAFKPPLLVSKQLASSIGGYFFDQRLRWKEDADLDQRLRAAGIPVVPVEDGVIYHGSISLRSDLRSAFRYGVGLALAESLLVPVTQPSRSFVETLRGEGLLAALYMLFSNRVRAAGYWCARARLLLGLERFPDGPKG